MPGVGAPDWYPVMQGCRYLGESFCERERIPWWVVRRWGMIAQQAEAEAEAVLIERARAK